MRVEWIDMFQALGISTGRHPPGWVTFPDEEFARVLAHVQPQPKARARKTDLETSKEAARSLTVETLTELQTLVYGALKTFPNGLTTVEIARKVNVERDTISPRILPMVEAGIVVNTGRTRVPEGKTRAGVVWALNRGDQEEPDEAV